MAFCLDLVRAKKGDCFFIHFGKEADAKKHRLILVDGGPRGVYAEHLKERLSQIRTHRKLDFQQALPIELLMVSHVDDDHIQGLIDLTNQEIEEKSARRPRLLNVKSFWHNSFDSVIGSKPDELTASIKTQFGPASLSGDGDMPAKERCEVEELYLDDHPDEDHVETVTSSLKVLASIEQGHVLALNARNLRYPLNRQFGGQLVIARDDEAGRNGVEVGPGLKLVVIGPMQKEIEALHEKHQAWLKELAKKGKSPPAQLAAYVDKSIPNLSSIVVLAEFAGRKMLLTGDARGDKILQGLEMVGLLGPDGRIEVDLLKVPHHGSANNLDTDFFERIRARHYVFSGNGEHGNPEREAFEMLFKARGDEPLTIHLTYPIAEIDRARKKDWEEQRKKELKRKERGSEKAVRAEWSDEDYGLAAFFDARTLAAGQRIEIVEKGKPHLIDVTENA